jgi:glycosyltransferase involved in cell wall biosynthesis
MKMLCLAKYPWKGPSSRYRFYQFQPYLEAAGIRSDVHALHDERYLDLSFAGARPGTAYLAGRVASRLLKLCSVKHYHLVFIQKEVFPHAPGVVEALIERMGVPMVLDLDDAIHLPYRGTRLANKIPRVIARATLVLAGNHYLADYARRFNPNVVLFPTVVDTDHFTPSRERAANERPVVGWIGSPATSRYLQGVMPALEQAARRAEFDLAVVGDEGVKGGGVRVHSKPWTAGNEADDLRAMDVGIMPLPDDEWAEGKCALKLLQYMAAGVASVASPRGGARDIVRDGENAFLAEGDAQWSERVGALVAVAELRRRVGAAGRAWVESHYSLARYGPRLAAHLLDVAAGRAVSE